MTKLTLAALSLATLAGCASTTHTFTSIVNCDRDRGDVSFEKACRFHYLNEPLTVKVESVQNLGVVYTTLFAEAGDSKKMIDCSIKGTRYRNRIEKLKPGEMIDIIGTPTEVTRRDDVTFVHMDECEPTN
ncbi:MAG: hypothetical protein JST80_03345 [Bdellovibrionales bacterium]|nr:hypothetical protein [Bdellovibrionales bacterium]